MGSDLAEHLVRNVPWFVFAAELAIAAGIAGIGLYVAGRSALFAWALAVARRANAAAAQGYARVEGRAQPFGQPITSPLTRSPCVWYHAVVEEAHRNSRTEQASGYSWGKIHEETSDEPFLVVDESGSLRVEPYGADVTPTDRSLWVGRNRQPEDRDPPRLPASVNPRGGMVRFEVIDGGAHRFRYFEERIYPGDPLLVQGDVRTAAPAGGKRAKPAAGVDPRVLRRTGRWREPFLVAAATRATMARVYAGGSVGALMVAAFGAGLVAWLFWLRGG